MLKIGCHLSTEGGYLSMGERIASVNGDTFQYFTKNPKGGNRNFKKPDPADVEALRVFLTERGMTMPLAHAPYTYNSCSANEKVRRYSRDSMHDELLFLEALPGSLYNFHPGCHTGQGVEAGVNFIASMLDQVLWDGMHTTVLLETMAGKGTELGRSFEELRQIIDRVDAGLRGNVGVCFDTCHVSDAGYPIVADLDGVLAEFDRVIGLDRLCAIHVNDSKNPCGAHKDRHEKLGQGHLGEDFFRRLVCHPQLRHLPFYLETPNDMDGYAADIRLLRQYSEQ
jgi:deoxyribonuclease-4